MNVTAKTLTPVCVRSGEVFSSLFDFVIGEQQVHFVDKGKLQQLFRQNLPLARDFTKMVFQGQKSIASFLTDHHLRPEDFLSFSVPLRGAHLEQRSRQLYLPVLSPQGVYLPGSSLKGMIRSALLFTYLREKGTAPLREARSVYTGENIFRKDPKHLADDALRFLRVSDSTPVSFEKLMVYELKRLASSEGRGSNTNGGIPLLILAVPLGVTFSFTLQIDPQFQKADIPDFWKTFLAQGEAAILQSVRFYTETVLEREIQILQTLPRYQGLLKFYQKMRPHLQTWTLFHLGFGKTYFFNSVGCFLGEAELREIFRNNRRVRIGPSFPSTRFVISEGESQIPLGWLVVTKEERR